MSPLEKDYTLEFPFPQSLPDASRRLTRTDYSIVVRLLPITKKNRYDKSCFISTLVRLILRPVISKLSRFNLFKEN